MTLHRYLLIAALAAAPALAQQPAKTTEQQARSYVASAFITGAAPTVMSDKVTVSPALRQALGLPADANGAAVYKALINMTANKPVQVRRAVVDEVAQSQAPAPISEQPLFTVEAGDTTLYVQYDLARDNISFVGAPSSVAMASPVVAPTPPQKVSEPAIAEAPRPAPAAPAAQPPAPAPAPSIATAPAPAPSAAAPQPKPLQVVEPQIPRMAPKAAAPTAVAAAAPQRPVYQEEPRPVLKKSGPCDIKPVMTDQDLVNCGATPR
jgi:hypothetical protein